MNALDGTWGVMVKKRGLQETYGVTHGCRRKFFVGKVKDVLLVAGSGAKTIDVEECVCWEAVSGGT